MQGSLQTALGRASAVLIAAIVAFALPAHAQAPEGDFPGVIAPEASQSTPAWPARPNPPANAPNIVIIMLDDIGFADTSTFGGIARTPAMSALAQRGLSYNNFNVTAMCSPTRAALLTGRNHHRVGFGIISEGANGYPGYNSYWDPSTASVAEVLRQSGYRTAMVGKWHNTPEWEITRAGPFDRWPTGLGFEHFYGFLGAEDNHWEPVRLYRDTTPVEAPTGHGEQYHLTTGLADHAITWLQEHRSFAPDRPYFLYFATGAVHTPHHAPEEWIARYRGQFDAGWDVLREEIFARQQGLGIVPAEAVLPPRPAQVPAWDSLSPEEQRLFARQMEVYAAFVAHTDYQLSRLLQAVQQGPGGDNTLIFLIAGDNGAVGRPLPGYGGEASLDQELARIDALGSAAVPFNQYHGGWGWMGNTPFRYWKGVASHFGGLRAPLIVSWPSRFPEGGQLRQQFQHVTDIVPTIYDLIGLAPPAELDGVVQEPMDGRSMLATLRDATAPTPRRTQYFELSGSRAIYHEGWMASALSAFMAPDGNAESWEPFNLAEDFTQARDLAAEHPERLAEMRALFEREAWDNDVYPLLGAAWSPSDKPFPMGGRQRYDYTFGMGRVPWAQLPPFQGSHALEADVSVPAAGASGVLATFGYRHKGFVWYVENGHLVYENRAGTDHQRLVSVAPLPAGRSVLRYEFACDNCPEEGRMRQTMTGTARLLVNGEVVAEQILPGVNLINAGEAFGFYLGHAAGTRVSDAFDAPFPFNGTIARLSIIPD